jgi:hypothetical protein
VNNFAAEEIASQASSHYDYWQTMQYEVKREIVEVITDEISDDKDEITISITYSASCKVKIWQIGGGRGGIRTHGSLATTLDFESRAFNHSATLPSI